MSIALPANLKPTIGSVLDERCAGIDALTDSVSPVARGLLRYETNTDTWKYYKNATDGWTLWGVGSWIDTQLQTVGNLLLGKSNTVSPTFTGDVVLPSTTTVGGQVPVTNNASATLNTLSCSSLEVREWNVQSPGLIPAQDAGFGAGCDLGKPGRRYGAVVTHSLTYGVGGQVSDDRLKFHETEINDALATILRLNPRTYDKTALEGQYVRESGLIAQDLLQIPELSHCVFGSHEDYYGVNYNGVLAYLIKAVQELSAQVDNLQTTE